MSLSALFSLGLMASAARAVEGDPGDIFTNKTNKGSRLGVITPAGFSEMKAHFWKAPEPEPPFYEYGTASVCGGAPGDPDGGNECGRAAMCDRANTPTLIGPPIAAWRREVDAGGVPVPRARWDKVGDTCQPERIPGNEAALTMAMIQAAFHDTEFTVPTVNIQPEGDVTLVNLPTYFEVQFPEKGFGPDEVDDVDPARMLGHLVQVRPVLKSVTYHLGAQTIGPTDSLGGPYPDGDVAVTYRTAGTQKVRVDVTYTGQYRLGTAGPWRVIPGDVTREGTTVDLEVREARSRLYTG